MAKFCNNCGTEAADESAFCSECGAKLTLEYNTAPLNDYVESSEEQYTEQSTEQTFEEQPPVYEPPTQYIPTGAPIPETDASCKVAGVGTFFGLEFLFALPFIGWIICIIMAFAPKNKNIKNFARAKLIWLLIGIVFSLILVAAALVIWNIVVRFLESTALSSLNELVYDSAYSMTSDLGWLEDILSK